MKSFSRILFALGLVFGTAHAQVSSLDADQITSHIAAKNYARKLGNFEKNVGGVVAFADAAGVDPVDGVGGSPSVLCQRSTSSPLRGQASLLITKDAANRQGQGCSVDFDIDSADKAKWMRIDLEGIVGSGTFVAGTTSASSDLELRIYDKTNAALIPISTQKIFSNSTTISESYSGYFKTATNSTSYRLIWFIPTTSASAWTYKVDGVSIGVPASSSAALSYYSASTQSISTGTSTKLTFATKEFDRSSSVSSSTFTAPAPAVYKICGMVTTAATQSASTNSIHTITAYKNGVAFRGIAWNGATGTYQFSVNGCRSFDLVTGDTIELYYFQNSPGSWTIGGTDQTYFSVEKTGGL